MKPVDVCLAITVVVGIAIMRLSKRVQILPRIA